MKLFQLPDDIFISIYRIIYADSLQIIKTMNIFYEMDLNGIMEMPTIDEYFGFNGWANDFKYKMLCSNSNFRKEFIFRDEISMFKSFLVKKSYRTI
jgi:hypothetical protein